MLEPLPIQEDQPILTVVPSAQEQTIKTAEMMLSSIDNGGLRHLTLEIEEVEEQIIGYYLPNNPNDYASNLGLAACVGQTSVTIAGWYEILKPYFPDWYLKDENGKWRRVAIIEFTDYSLACAKDIPIRDVEGRPKVDENGKFVKVKNPFKAKYGWEGFYRPLLEERLHKHNSSAITVIPDEVKTVKGDIVPLADIGDESWLRQNPEMLKLVSDLQTSFGGGGSAIIANSIYEKEKEQYRQRGRTVELNLLNEMRAGRFDIQQLAGLPMEVLLQLGLPKEILDKLIGEDVAQQNT